MTARSIAEEYHRLTKYTPDNVRAGPGLDWSSQPEPFKEIVSSRRVSLRDFPRSPADAPPEPPGVITVAMLGRMLFHACGVTGMLRFRGGGSQYLRAAPSAGALYPTEVYVAVRDVDGLDAGIYHYQARSHELVPLWEGDQFTGIQQACGAEARLDGARVVVILTAIFWRSAWRYQERGYRRVLLDTGHVLANLAAYAPLENCVAQPLAAFLDAELNGLFFFDDTREAAVCAVPIFEADELPRPPPLWTSRAGGDAAVSAQRITAEADLAGSATVHLHRAGHCAAAAPAPAPEEEPPGVSDRSIRLEHDPRLALSVPDAIERRRSARGYSGDSISLGDLGRVLGYTFGRSDPATDRAATRDAGLLHAHVVARNVDGLESGLYEVEGDGEALLPLSVGDFQQELFHVSLGQEIARDAAATLIFTAPVAPALRCYGDRAYRYLHLDAGHLGERMQLAAVLLDLGACGIGGFFDDEAAALSDVNTDDFVLYLVTLGRS